MDLMQLKEAFRQQDIAFSVAVAKVDALTLELNNKDSNNTFASNQQLLNLLKTDLEVSLIASCYRCTKLLELSLSLKGFSGISLQLIAVVHL
jgi:hypothetical protein